QIMNLIDSAFAIGDSRQEISLHYIKQIKSRNTRYLYDKDNVLLCKIVKDSNFLRFEFLGEAMEIDHLESPDPMPKEKLVEFIKREYPKGRSARSIAASAGYSHTTVNRVIADLISEGELKERGSGNLPDVTQFLKVTEVSTVSTFQKMETTEQSEHPECSIPPEQESHKNCD
ncbi:MAG: helix-turn-helix domain-containing protein, partial [Candidatus Cryptobacteroides sp.]